MGAAVLEAMWQVLLDLSAWLLLGAVVAGALHLFVSAQWIRRNLSGPTGVIRAVLFGVPLPLCSCGVIPAGLGLKQDGADDASSVAFLISTPQTGVDSVLVAASFLGWPFALFKIGAAAATGLVGGFVTLAAGGPRLDLVENVSGEVAPARTLRGAVEHSTMLLRAIWRWVVFGVVASAIITVWVPESWLAGLSSAGGLIAVLAVAIPLYVCATSSVPVAAALVAAGMPIGAALVFLMAGPATNMATLGAVKRGFGTRILVIYLATIVVGSLGLGLAFDAWFGGQVAPVVGHAHGEAAWWSQAAAFGLMALMALFAVEEARSWWRGRNPAGVEFGVSGMTCGGCARRLERALQEVEGVEQVAITLEPGSVRIVGSAPAADIREAIEAAGFKAA